MALGIVYSFANMKGGAGKTTGIGNAAVALAKKGYNVLVVDTDQQADLTTMMCVDQHKAEYTIADALYHPPRVPVNKLPVKAPFPLPSNATGSVWIIPSEERSLMDGIVNIQRENAAGMGGEKFLALNLEPLKNVFDFILLDTRPGRELITQSCFLFSDLIVATFMGTSTWNLKHALETGVIADTLRKRNLGHAQFAGLLFTSFDERLKTCRKHLKMLKAMKTPYCPVLVPSRVDASESEERRKPPIGSRKPKHDLSKAYDEVADWMVQQAYDLVINKRDGQTTSGKEGVA